MIQNNDLNNHHMMWSLGHISNKIVQTANDTKSDQQPPSIGQDLSWT